MTMANLYGRLRTWLTSARPDTVGAIPTEAQPVDEVSRTGEHAQPPPIPSAELPQMESDIVVVEEEDPEMRAWADAFVAATSGRER